MTTLLYGIPNCDTVKKARTWLTDRQHEVVFHDFKKAGLDRATVEGWLQRVDWEVLVNRKGTTWRALDEARKATIVDAEQATVLMLENPSIIKRPVLVTDTQTVVGFSDDTYQQIFKK
ncbi:ArsC family reductase [Actimicrobium sp. CCC2.4]|uniref:ArsC family reductase n=1 Tax=Actimicrobium sp. CCC2.4 TaxID=3048606 RepID=UPI002AC8F9A0|nr:ArsC family reductase [Actimicrobium sp. CCC2.4]MEB0136463.1 ArsC family reductase [Actimicrobium sp. CCC2.4]WPX30823.1 ArsC family reductase [Actimicrobium sp. CCC2.4]